MVHDRGDRHRRSIRLAGYDYAQTGAYFITVCTHGHKCVLGRIGHGQMHLNGFGRIVEREWRRIERLRENVRLGAYVVMPNHFHGVVFIAENGEGTARRAPTPEGFGVPVRGSLPTILRSFKSAVTRQINATRSTPGAPVWQRSYHEHVIRNEKDLDRIREYIMTNPEQWPFDRENPDRTEPAAPEPFSQIDKP